MPRILEMKSDDKGGLWVRIERGHIDDGHGGASSVSLFSEAEVKALKASIRRDLLQQFEELVHENNRN